MCAKPRVQESWSGESKSLFECVLHRNHFWSRNPRPKMVSGGHEFMQVLAAQLLTSRDHFWFRNPRPKMVSGGSEFMQVLVVQLLISRDHF